jgi:hypothetical protein
MLRRHTKRVAHVYGVAAGLTQFPELDQSKFGIYMNTKPSMISDGALLKATGKTWAQRKKFCKA